MGGMPITADEYAQVRTAFAEVVGGRVNFSSCDRFSRSWSPPVSRDWLEVTMGIGGRFHVVATTILDGDIKAAAIECGRGALQWADHIEAKSK